VEQVGGADGAEVALGLVRIIHQVRNLDDRSDLLGNRRRRVDDDQLYAATPVEPGELRAAIVANLCQHAACDR
jgi:hypothetical protein